MNSKRLLMGIFVTGLLVWASVLLAQSRPLKKVQVGVPAISMGNIIIYFTKEAKIFEKYGLDVDPVAVAGSGIASKALIAGSVLISPIATPTVMTAVLDRQRYRRRNSSAMEAYGRPRRSPSVKS